MNSRFLARAPFSIPEPDCGVNSVPLRDPPLIAPQKMKSYLFILALMSWALVPVKAQDVKELSGVSISPSGLVWFIQVFPGGSVSASYGSLPQHQIQMQPGSVNFAALIERIKQETTDKKGPEGTQAALMLRGESSHASKDLLEDDFLRRAFPSTPAAWKRILPKLDKDMKPDGFHIEPISKEMEAILKKHPIFPKTNAEQDGAGQRR